MQIYFFALISIYTHFCWYIVLKKYHSLCLLSNLIFAESYLMIFAQISTCQTSLSLKLSRTDFSIPSFKNSFKNRKRRCNKVRIFSISNFNRKLGAKNCICVFFCVLSVLLVLESNLLAHLVCDVFLLSSCKNGIFLQSLSSIYFFYRKMQYFSPDRGFLCLHHPFFGGKSGVFVGKFEYFLLFGNYFVSRETKNVFHVKHFFGNF